jgi:competence protein CoiA
MKFALANGERQQAQPNLSGECPGCGGLMVARCGEVRVHHWAHKGRRYCDPWWEPETEWHRNWKNRFPDSWQEIIHHAEDGERHIADVKTDDGWVVEFQHSYIQRAERRSREAFYKKLVWVVDGLRRKRDGPQLQKAWEEGRPVTKALVRVAFSDECRLLREWAGSPAPIFFDFGGEYLGWLLAVRSGGPVYIFRCPRSQFIESHLVAPLGFGALAEMLTAEVAKYESQGRAQISYADPLALRRRPRRRL